MAKSDRSSGSPFEASSVAWKRQKNAKTCRRWHGLKWPCGCFIVLFPASVSICERARCALRLRFVGCGSAFASVLCHVNCCLRCVSLVDLLLTCECLRLRSVFLSFFACFFLQSMCLFHGASAARSAFRFIASWYDCIFRRLRSTVLSTFWLIINLHSSIFGVRSTVTWCFNLKSLLKFKNEKIKCWKFCTKILCRKFFTYEMLHN